VENEKVCNFGVNFAVYLNENDVEGGSDLILGLCWNDGFDYYLIIQSST